jgi:hypothetical protein
VPTTNADTVTPRAAAASSMSSLWAGVSRTSRRAEAGGRREGMRASRRGMAADVRQYATHLPVGEVESWRMAPWSCASAAAPETRRKFGGQFSLITTQDRGWGLRSIEVRRSTSARL